jgi:hypothetical protein
MKRIGQCFAINLAAFIGFTAAAGAASLSISTDKLTYLVGETVDVTVTGLPQGGTDSAIRGQLQYSAALTDTVTSSQTLHTTLGVPWTEGTLNVGDGFADVFNQSRVLATIVDQNQIATATLTAAALGTVNLSWNTSSPALDFFGLTSGTGASFTIVPESGTGLLVGLGLLGLALFARRRSR